MSQSSAIRAGSAFVELFTKDNLLVSGLRAAQQKIKAFGSAIAGIGTQFATLGAAIWAPLLGAAKSFAESGSEMLLLSQRTGISVEALSQLAFASSQSGVATEDLETAIKKMSKTIQAAADGTHTARESLASLGLTVAEIANLTPDEQFLRMARGIAAITNPTTRAARALEVFGRGGTSILPLLNQGEQGIRAFMAQADRLGLTKSEESVQAAFRLQVAFKTMARVVEAAWNAVGSAIAPVLTDAIGAIVPVVASVRGWVKDNRALFVTLTAVGGVLVGIGSALLSVAGVVKLVGIAMGPLITILGAGFAIAGIAIKAVLGYLMLFTTPLGLLIVLFDVLKTYILSAAFASTNTFGALKDGFNNVLGVATTAWAGITDSIAAGDWGGAANIAWLGIQIAFETGVLSLKIVWREFSGFFIDVWQQMVSTVAGLMENLVRGFQRAMADVRRLLNIAMASPIEIEQARTRWNAVQARIREFRQHNPGADLPSDLQRELTEARAGRDRFAPGAGDRLDFGASTIQSTTDAERDLRQREAAASTAADQAKIAALREQIQLEAQGAAAKRSDMEIWNELFPSGGPAAPGGALDQSRAKVDTAGTFSAFAVGGLGAATLTERLLDEIANNTAAMANRPDPGLT